MKRTAHSLAYTGLLLALPLLTVAMDNKDIIKMHKAGLSEETIIAAMHKEKADYDTGTDALIDLKAAGVDEKVILTMISLQAPRAGAPSASAAPRTSAAPASPPASDAAASPDSHGTFWQEFPSIAPPKVDPAIGTDYFTRFTFHEEKNEHKTTNYARGSIVPINTPVKLVSMAGTKLTLLRLDTRQEIKVENVEKFSKKSITEIARIMLAAEKTPLDKLPAEVASAVRSGEMRKGMTKELVLMTRGYPPGHETPSIEGDRWIYWSSRFVKHTLVFANGRLSEGRGLY
ncbi:MAG: hypothetical protein ABIO94_06010 [Opitutaceae bacterium]